MGTDEDRLVRAVVSRRHVLYNINTRFMQKYGKSINGRVDSEASGNFKKVLLAITQGV